MTADQKVSYLKAKYRIIEFIGTLCIVLSSIISMHIIQPIHHVLILNIAALMFILFTTCCTYSYKEELKNILR